MTPLPTESPKRLALAGQRKFRVVTATSERETFDRDEAERWAAESGASVQVIRFVQDATDDGEPFIREVAE